MQLLSWSQYTLTNNRSWAALGLTADPTTPRRAKGSYDHEGQSLTLLREAAQRWSNDHPFQARHILAAPQVNGWHPAAAVQVACCVAALCIPDMPVALEVVQTPANSDEPAVCGLLITFCPTAS